MIEPTYGSRRPRLGVSTSGNDCVPGATVTMRRRVPSGADVIAGTPPGSLPGTLPARRGPVTVRGPALGLPPAGLFFASVIAFSLPVASLTGSASRQNGLLCNPRTKQQ